MGCWLSGPWNDQTLNGRSLTHLSQRDALQILAAAQHPITMQIKSQRRGQKDDHASSWEPLPLGLQHLNLPRSFYSQLPVPPEHCDPRFGFMSSSPRDTLELGLQDPELSRGPKEPGCLDCCGPAHREPNFTSQGDEEDFLDAPLGFLPLHHELDSGLGWTDGSVHQGELSGLETEEGGVDECLPRPGLTPGGCTGLGGSPSSESFISSELSDSGFYSVSTGEFRHFQRLLEKRMRLYNARLQLQNEPCERRERRDSCPKSHLLEAIPESLPILRNQDNMGLHRNQDNIALLRNQENMGHHRNQENMGHHRNQENMGMHRGNSENMAIHRPSPESLPILRNQDRVYSDSLQDNIPLHRPSPESLPPPCPQHGLESDLELPQRGLFRVSSVQFHKSDRPSLNRHSSSSGALFNPAHSVMSRLNAPVLSTCSTPSSHRRAMMPHGAPQQPQAAPLQPLRRSRTLHYRPPQAEYRRRASHPASPSYYTLHQCPAAAAMLEQHMHNDHSNMAAHCCDAGYAHEHEHEQYWRERSEHSRSIPDNLVMEREREREREREQLLLQQKEMELEQKRLMEMEQEHQRLLEREREREKQRLNHLELEQKLEAEQRRLKLLESEKRQQEQKEERERQLKEEREDRERREREAAESNRRRFRDNNSSFSQSGEANDTWPKPASRNLQHSGGSRGMYSTLDAPAGSASGARGGASDGPVSGGRGGASDGPVSGGRGGALDRPVSGGRGRALDGSVPGGRGGALDGPVSGGRGGALDGPVSGGRGGALDGPVSGGRSGALDAPVSGSRGGCAAVEAPPGSASCGRSLCGAAEGPVSGGRGGALDGPVSTERGGALDGPMPGGRGGALDGSVSIGRAGALDGPAGSMSGSRGGCPGVEAPFGSVLGSRGGCAAVEAPFGSVSGSRGGCPGVEAPFGSVSGSRGGCVAVDAPVGSVSGGRSPCGPVDGPFVGPSSAWDMKKAQTDAKLTGRPTAATRVSRSQMLRDRATQLADERSGMSTDEETNADMFLGRYWSRTERKEHFLLAREQRQQQQARGDRSSSRERERNPPEPDPRANTVLELSHRKLTRLRNRKLLDDWTTVEELLTHGSRLDAHEDALTCPSSLLTVTTV